MSADIANVPKADLVARFQRMQSMVKNVRNETAQIAERALNTTAALGGGAISGICRGWDDEVMMVPGTEIPLDVGLAAGMILAGVTGLAGKASDGACALGGGIGAGALAFHVRDAVKNRDKK